MYKHSFIRLALFPLVLLLGSGFAQTSDKMKALNFYVEFLNESVHGLSVAQILFVNYNKDLNRHVDLESHKINTHITNMELGANIFDNPDINTSDSNVSAMMLAKLTKENSKYLSNGTARILNEDVAEIVNILDKVNNLRFEIEEFIAKNDLEVKENIYKCYVYLEKAVALFDNYADKHDNLSKRLRQEILYEYKPLDFIFYEIHTETVKMLKQLRNAQSQDLGKYLTRIEGAKTNFRERGFAAQSVDPQLANDILSQVEQMLTFVKEAERTNVLPDNFKNNSKSYYVHNRLLLSYFNSISPGFISKMNKLMELTDPDFLHYDDRPVKYEVTYPEKMVEIEEIATREVVNTTDFPLDLKSKDEIVVVNPNDEPEPELKPAVPKQQYIDLEFYDPDLIDRDSITVNFNSEVILENYTLLKEPMKIRMDIDTYEGNSITIFAKNEGIISPNTVAFKYRYNGEGRKKTVVRRLTTNTAYEYVLTIDGLGGVSDKWGN